MRRAIKAFGSAADKVRPGVHLTREKVRFPENVLARADTGVKEERQCQLASDYPFRNIGGSFTAAGCHKPSFNPC